MRPLPYVLGTWFGAGRFPRMPGTAGAALGVLAIAFIPGRAYGVSTGILTLFGLLIAPRIADIFIRETGRKDPQSFVLDEALGVWIAAWSYENPGWKRLALAFLLFRLFDITKPWPIRAVERLPGGWGVVYDDVVAGLAAFALSA